MNLNCTKLSINVEVSKKYQLSSENWILYNPKLGRLKNTKRKGRVFKTIQEITNGHLKIFELCCNELIVHTE